MVDDKQLDEVHLRLAPTAAPAATPAVK